MHPLALEQDFRMRAGRLQSWGIGVLVCAALFWIYAAWQVFTPYDSTYNAVDCPAQINAKPRDLYYNDPGYTHESALQCASDRSWPKPLAALVLSLPLSAIGTALLTAGTVSVRLRRHDEELKSAQS